MLLGFSGFLNTKYLKPWKPCCLFLLTGDAHAWLTLIEAIPCGASVRSDLGFLDSRALGFKTRVCLARLLAPVHHFSGFGS